MGQGMQGPQSTGLIKACKRVVSPQLRSWIQNVIVPGLVDAYLEQVKNMPAAPTETLASSHHLSQSSRAAAKCEFSEES